MSVECDSIFNALRPHPTDNRGVVSSAASAVSAQSSCLHSGGLHVSSGIVKCPSPSSGLLTGVSMLRDGTGL